VYTLLCTKKHMLCQRDTYPSEIKALANIELHCTKVTECQTVCLFCQLVKIQVKSEGNLISSKNFWRVNTSVPNIIDIVFTTREHFQAAGYWI